MVKPKLQSIWWSFARYGNVTFGGGSATIAELEREIIDQRQWISHDQSRLAFALSRITPGTNLLAYCAGVGWQLRGAIGALATLLGASIPVSFLALVVTVFYELWGGNRITAIALHGALVAAVAVTIATGWTLIRPYRGSGWLKIIIGAGGSLALALAGVTPLRVLLLAVLVGFAWPHQESRKT